LTSSSFDPRTRKLFLFFAYFSVAIIFIVVAYTIYSIATQGLGIIGQSLVNVEFPPPSLFPVYLKPITYLYFACLVLLYTGLELNKERISRWPPLAINLSKFFCFFVAIVFFFELAYNLVFWGGEIGAGAILGHLNPDDIANPFPELQHPVNVVFAAKLCAVFLIAGIYGYYFLANIDKSKNSAPPAAFPAPAPAIS
jgi:hypothetical protein